MKFFWENSESYLLLNPRYSTSEKKCFNRILKEAVSFPNHVWLSTSGSCVQKWVGLSKPALLASAQAVNQHLESDKSDSWMHALPHFHVGGLGIWARAYLSGAKVYDFKKEYPGKWSAENFYHYTQQVKGTLSALVPAQLQDLVDLKKQAPFSLRAIIIGGGALLPSLYEQAVVWGWPILPSYGLTECASQVATAKLSSLKDYRFPSLHLLSHIQACEKEEKLCFSGPSLLSTYAYVSHQEIQFVDPKIQGWLTTEDRGILYHPYLNVKGRADTMIKIGGENVDLANLENHLHMLKLQLNIQAEVTLIAMPDLRLGHCIELVSNSLKKEEIHFLIEEFQKSVFPFERIRNLYFIHQFPRSSLGKILKNELISLIGLQQKACNK